MHSVINWTHEIQKDPYDVGPLDELERRRAILAKYATIVDFLGTKEFNNFLIVLKMTRSKLVEKYRMIDSKITCELNEARDNVRYLQSLEKLWDPLYR